MRDPYLLSKFGCQSCAQEVHPFDQVRLRYYADGSPVPYGLVAQPAAERQVMLRTGCHCNAGACHSLFQMQVFKCSTCFFERWFCVIIHTVHTCMHAYILIWYWYYSISYYIIIYYFILYYIILYYIILYYIILYFFFAILYYIILSWSEVISLGDMFRAGNATQVSNIWALQMKTSVASTPLGRFVGMIEVWLMDGPQVWCACPLAFTPPSQMWIDGWRCWCTSLISSQKSPPRWSLPRKRWRKWHPGQLEPSVPWRCTQWRAVALLK